MKHRSKPAGSYATYMLSLAKSYRLQERLHEDTGKPCLACSSMDRSTLEMVDLAKCKIFPTVAMGGRGDPIEGRLTGGC